MDSPTNNMTQPLLNGSLSDSVLVRKLFALAGDEILYRLVKVATHTLKADQAKAMDDALARHLARALMGENPQFSAAENWSGLPCAQSLAHCAGSFYDEVRKAEKQCDENNPRVVMVLAVTAFERALYQAIEEQFRKEDVSEKSVREAVSRVVDLYALAAIKPESKQ